MPLEDNAAEGTGLFICLAVRAVLGFSQLILLLIFYASSVDSLQSFTKATCYILLTVCELMTNLVSVF